MIRSSAGRKTGKSVIRYEDTTRLLNFWMVGKPEATR
jgi:hypothetical protein